jgi:hypothetical protein
MSYTRDIIVTLLNFQENLKLNIMYQNETSLEGDFVQHGFMSDRKNDQMKAYLLCADVVYQSIY